MAIPYKVTMEARTMLRKKAKPDEIVAYFNGRFAWDDICTALERRRKSNRDWRQNNSIGRIAVNIAGGPPIPAEVLAIREKRKQLRYADLTAELMGDPRIGEISFFGTSSPSIVSDPLDGLVFGRITAV